MEVNKGMCDGGEGIIEVTRGSQHAGSFLTLLSSEKHRKTLTGGHRCIRLDKLLYGDNEMIGYSNSWVVAEVIIFNERKCTWPNLECT